MPTAQPRASMPKGYGGLSKRPLHVLVFLLPLIVAYEAGSLYHLGGTAHGSLDPLVAKGILHRLFEEFGGLSLHLPAITLVVVLLVWHALLRDPWRIRVSVVGGMWCESLVWTLPILVLWGLMGPSGPPAAAATEAPLNELTWQVRLTLSVGAGLYEELVFRLILVTAAHFVVADLLRLHPQAASVAAAVVSAIIFALFHDIGRLSGAVDFRLLSFYFLAGLVLSTLFLVRGFGIVVGAHALYDVMVLVLIPQALHR